MYPQILETTVLILGLCYLKVPLTKLSILDPDYFCQIPTENSWCGKLNMCCNTGPPPTYKAEFL